MKKFYSLALATMMGFAASAQIDVTFRVDMSGQAVSPLGVHVAGDWQAAAGFAADWQPGISEMTDAGDGIYELNVSLPAGQYSYKFVNGDNWGMDEQVPPLVAAGGNRFFAVTLDGFGFDGLELPAVQFGQAAPAGMEAARLSVDMALQEVSALGVHVAGSVFTPQWNPLTGPCFNSSGTTWTYVAYNVPGTYEYKFINGDDWGPNEWPQQGSGPAECTNGDDRVLELVVGGVETPAYCFNSCETCSDPNVVLTVDMNGVLVNNGGFVAGDFNGWSGQAMSDNGDGTYTIGLFLDPGTYQFKFQNGAGGWEDVPPQCNVGGNRVVEVTGDETETIMITSCIGQCETDEVCLPEPSAAEITFRVNMSNETVSPDGVFLISGALGWQGGAVPMTETGEGIYEATAMISGAASVAYKFVNGVVSESANEEFQGFPESPGPCTFDNGVGGWNRFHVRSGEPEVLPAVAYNSCEPLSVRPVAQLGMVNIFPNPSNGATFVEVENPNGYNLRMSILDVTGKVVSENHVLNTGRKQINTSNFAPGLYFINITNEKSERAIYKLIIR